MAEARFVLELEWIVDDVRSCRPVCIKLKGHVQRHPSSANAWTVAGEEWTSSSRETKQFPLHTLEISGCVGLSLGHRFDWVGVDAECGRGGRFRGQGTHGRYEANAVAFVYQRSAFHASLRVPPIHLSEVALHSLA